MAYPTMDERRRLAAAVRAIQKAHVVEGKLVTTRMISDTLGINIPTALRRAIRGPHPLTWANLEKRTLSK